MVKKRAPNGALFFVLIHAALEIAGVKAQEYVEKCMDISGSAEIACLISLQKSTQLNDRKW